MSKTKKMVEVFANVYRKFHKSIYDYEKGFRNYSAESIIHKQKIVGKIESAINHLNERDHFIIYNEVILGKSGNWYLEYFSESTYRRHAKEAYENFLSIVEQ